MTTLLATIFVLGVLIFIHELGHFTLAKLSGIRVEKFSIGFPPKLFSFRIGETEYAVGIIPLGGYVKMSGEYANEELTGDAGEFMSKPIWKRFLVIFAGPFMNFILAVVVLSLLYSFRGKEADYVQVGNVLPDSPAAMAGIQPGDNILNIDHFDVKSLAHINSVIYDKINEPVVVKWRRGDQIFNDTIITTASTYTDTSGNEVEYGSLGLGEMVIVGEVSSGKPAELGGLRSHDIILAVDSTPILSFAHMASLINKKVGEPVEISWKRGDEILSNSMTTYIDTAIYKNGDTVEIGLIGITERAYYNKLNFFTAIKSGFNQSIYYVRMVYEFVWGLIVREVPATQIGGPIFISQLAGATARAGLDILLEFLAMLSINLAVLNLLPLPIFDGSHIVYLIWEKIKGSPPSMKFRLVVQQIGIAFMLILIVFVVYNDVMRLLS
ncbi:MAG: RIP metalloprotease RseP [Candidatus Zixiibacteriota bacterium]